MSTMSKLISTAATVGCLAASAGPASALPAIDPATTSHGAAPTPAVVHVTSHSNQVTDIGLGAAGMLVLVGIGAGAVTATRGRGHHPVPN